MLVLFTGDLFSSLEAYFVKQGPHDSGSTPTRAAPLSQDDGGIFV